MLQNPEETMGTLEVRGSIGNLEEPVGALETGRPAGDMEKRAVLEVSGLTHRYRRVTALEDVSLSVPSGSVYALLGPNGAGKTTLLQILMGVRRPSVGSVRVFGKNVTQLTLADRARIGYVAEGQELPGWMTLQQLEAWLAPLYSTWDRTLAAELRTRFQLDAKRRIRTFSRGEKMKAALLCALAPRPELLLLDEPFTGIDVVTKDELVRGLLESAGTEGWTVLICSHDIAELELLADWVGFIDHGRIVVSEPLDVLNERFRHVDVIAETERGFRPPADWMAFDRAGPHLRFILADADASAEYSIRQVLPNATRIDLRPASLREIFVALAGAQTLTKELAQ